MAGETNLGTLVINLKGNDSGFSTLLKDATAALGHFGKLAKHAFNVVGKNNKEFKELHETFGDLGIGVGLVADAFMQFTGQGNLGLVDMVKNTRVLGHSLKTWATAGAVAAQLALEKVKAKVRILALQAEEQLTGVDNTAKIMTIDADAKNNAEALKREIDDIFGEDPEPAKVSNVSGAIEKEAKEARQAMHSFEVFNKGDVAGFLAFSQAGRTGAGPMAPSKPESATGAREALRNVVAGGGPAATAVAPALAGLEAFLGPGGAGTEAARNKLRAQAPGRFGNPSDHTEEILKDAGGRVSGPFGEAGARKSEAQLLEAAKALQNVVQKMDAIIFTSKANYGLAARAG